MRNRLDGRPNIVMESLAMGIPVIASRAGAIPEMAPEGSGCILCESGDAAAFAEAIRTLSGDRERHRQCATAARRHAGSRFSGAGGGEAYARLFRGVAAARSHSGRPPVAD